MEPAYFTYYVGNLAYEEFCELNKVPHMDLPLQAKHVNTNIHKIFQVNNLQKIVVIYCLTTKKTPRKSICNDLTWKQ
jgi:hypothetical protein